MYSLSGGIIIYLISRQLHVVHCRINELSRLCSSYFSNISDKMRCAVLLIGWQYSVVFWVKIAFVQQTLQISDSRDCVHKISILPLNFPKVVFPRPTFCIFERKFLDEKDFLTA